MSAVPLFDTPRLHIVQAQTAVTLRTLEPSDALQIRAMLERCSPETRRLRFLSSMPRVTARMVRLLSEPAPGAGGVVAVIGDRVIGMAHHGPVTDGAAEVAIVVEDVWQGRGIGKLLMGRLLAVLATRGARTVQGSMFRDNVAAIGLLEGTAADIVQTFDGPSLDFTARLPVERYAHPTYGMGTPRVRTGFFQRAPFPTPTAG